MPFRCLIRRNRRMNRAARRRMELMIMKTLYLISGPCGSGKTTLANALAAHLVQSGVRQAYIIHGDDVHSGFVEGDAKGGNGAFLSWEEILSFNWSCILFAAGRALDAGLDVVIDYVVEDELPLVRRLAEEKGARLIYIVLTAQEETIRRRLTQRGNEELIDRALFLREKLENMRENIGHLYDNSCIGVEQMIAQMDIARFEIPPEGTGATPQIERIARMERLLNASQATVRALEEALDRYEAAGSGMRELFDYYSSAQWMQDFEDDAADRSPSELRRGVLSEDAVYNLIADRRGLRERMLRLTQEERAIDGREEHD